MFNRSVTFQETEIAHEVSEEWGASGCHLRSHGEMRVASHLYLNKPRCKDHSPSAGRNRRTRGAGRGGGGGSEARRGAGTGRASPCCGSTGVGGRQLAVEVSSSCSPSSLSSNGLGGEMDLGVSSFSPLPSPSFSAGSASFGLTTGAETDSLAGFTLSGWLSDGTTSVSLSESEARGTGLRPILADGTAGGPLDRSGLPL